MITEHSRYTVCERLYRQFHHHLLQTFLLRLKPVQPRETFCQNLQVFCFVCSLDETKEMWKGRKTILVQRNVSERLQCQVVHIKGISYRVFLERVNFTVSEQIYIRSVMLPKTEMFTWDYELVDRQTDI